LRDGAERLRELVDELEPAVVAVAGITAYRDAFGARGAQQGRQPEGIGPAEVWVVPNPSGLNAHETVDTLANRYHEAAEAAGIA
jgi:TDG/mug DNA glycosylase family protein